MARQWNDSDNVLFEQEAWLGIGGEIAFGWASYRLPHTPGRSQRIILNGIFQPNVVNLDLG